MVAGEFAQCDQGIVNCNARQRCDFAAPLNDGSYRTSFCGSCKVIVPVEGRPLKRDKKHPAFECASISADSDCRCVRVSAQQLPTGCRSDFSERKRASV